MNSETNNEQDIKITRMRTRETLKKRRDTRKAIADKTADYFGVAHRAETITIRTSPEFKKRIGEYAKERGMSVSEYINSVLELLITL